MESEEETADMSLSVNHLSIDWFNDYGEHWWVLETEVLEFNFALGYKRCELDEGMWMDLLNEKSFL